MRIYTKAGDLAFSTFTFPDGQPHFKLETYEREFDAVTIETAIRNPTELFGVMLVADVLRSSGFTSINLDIRYLLAARMDRAIGASEPFTLAVVGRLLNSCGFSRVRILDAHSEVATRLIRGAKNVLPHRAMGQVQTALNDDFLVCAPDKGSFARVHDLMTGIDIQGSKVRNPSTGALEGFKFTLEGCKLRRANVLIVDDICDGGGTFLGLAKVLKEAGAHKVYLYVTHGIFSKGALDASLIEHTFTTNSFRDAHELSRVTTIPVNMEKL